MREVILFDFGTTPNRLSFFIPRNKALARYNALIKKVEFTVESSEVDKIYSFKVNDIEGIQIGDPSMNRFINIFLFDKVKRTYLLTFKDMDSQDEINFIINSVRFDYERP